MTSYYIKRQEVFLGKTLKHGESGNKHLRLSNTKDPWVRPVHEVWNVSGMRKTLESPLLHYSGLSISDFASKINDYSTRNAKHLHENNIKVDAFDIIIYPLAKFLHNYIFKLGFLDGIHGFVHAMFMSFHSFLTRGKLWLLNNKITNK